MSSNSQRPVHYILSTHWDREWYLPFQAFRERMVSLFDELLAGIASGELKGPMTMDGQSIPVEDYLEIRLEKRGELLAAIRAGKMRLGPWYVMPDEFLVSGESIVRNLRYGRALAREYGGEPSNVGFLCDMFGHTGQMPQIFNGFGIRSGFIWRGNNNFAIRHLRWQSPDGSELLCYRRNYCDFSFKVRRAGEPDTVLDENSAMEYLHAYLKEEKEATALAPVLLFDGGDHQYWDRTVYKAITSYCAEEVASQIIHSDLDAYFAAVLKDPSPVTTLVTGELREPSSATPPDDDQWMIPGCLASRVWIKQQNAACEHSLTRWAEPWSAFVAQHENLGGYIHQAWRWLLQNHPHDSMGGCSVDQVHEDMRYRFSQCQQLTANVIKTALMTVAANSGPSLAEDEIKCVIFNSQPTARLGEVIEVELPLPQSWKIHPEAHNFEFQPNFRLFNEKEEEIPWLRVAMPKKSDRALLHRSKFPQVVKATVVKALVRVDLPACGYVTLIARENKAPLQVRHSMVPGIAVSDCALDNGILHVEMNDSGGVTLADHRNGNVFSHLLTMEDSADIGDGWCHAAPFQDEIYSSRAVGASVAVTLNTPFAAKLKVTYEMSLPAEYLWQEQRRSEAKRAVTVSHEITLKQGVDHIEVETTIENSVRDHRMRVLFPSEVREATHWLADAAFDVVERPIALRADNHLYREQEVETKPMQTWLAVHGKGRGLAVVTEGGLLEGGVRDVKDRPLALTLFRGTKRTVFTEGEQGGQLLGSMRFRYAVVPFDQAPDRTKLASIAHSMAGAIRTISIMRPEEKVLRQGGSEKPLSHSFFKVEGDAVLTSFRVVDGAIELRVYNPNETDASLTLDVSGLQGIGSNAKAAEPINLEGTSLGGAIPIQEGTFKIAMKPKKIASYRLVEA